MKRILTVLAIALALGGCKKSQTKNNYSNAEYASAAVGDKSGVVMHATRLSATIDGLEVPQNWLNALATLLGDDRGKTLKDTITTVREFTDGRYGIYTLARARHWWTADSARHESTMDLAGSQPNWDFQTGDTYPRHWTHDWMVKHPNDGTRGPSNVGVRRLYQRFSTWERWSK